MNAPVAITALTLPEQRGCYYGGAWHGPLSGRMADTINPGTGESLGKVADGGAADVDAAVAAARAAFRDWRNVLPLERAKMLRRIAEVLRKHAQELAMIDAANCGNPVREMTSDAGVAGGAARFLRGAGHRNEGRVDPDGAGRRQLLGARAARASWRASCPFNHPFMFCRGQGSGAACRRQHRRDQAARSGAAVGAAPGRADRRSAAGRAFSTSCPATARPAPRWPRIRASGWWRSSAASPPDAR